MQPEGSTTECPSFTNSGTFTLRPFDDRSLPPSSSRKMGIHIPIDVDGNTLYSYWFSYKIGVDGKAANGLTVHLSWFDLGGYFGASYDSINFDAFGDTDTTDDSFVLENTCYHLSPPLYLKDRAYEAALQVQPVVCVDSVDVGNSITVSVSFLDEDNPPTPQVQAQEIDLACTNSGSDTGFLTLNLNSYNLIHVDNVGENGEIELDLCARSGGRAKAYFYDR